MNRIEKIKESILSYSDIILLYIIVYLNEAILRLNTGLDFSKKAILYNLLLVSLISLVLINISKRIRKYIVFVLCLLISIYSFAQNYHFYFFNTFFSFVKLSIIGELGDVIKELYVNYNNRLLLFLIPLAINITYLVITRKKSISYKFNYIKLACSVVGFLLILFIYINVNSSNNIDDKNYNDYSDEYLYAKMPNKYLFLNRFGTLSFIERDISIIIEKNSVTLTKEQDDEIKEYILSSKHETNAYSGIFKNKNIIFILAESLAPFGIDEKITPTLYKLSNEGLYFNNFYAPLYPSNTADSEFIALTSLIPSLYKGTTTKTFTRNYYPYCLPKLFVNEGYKTNAYHSGIKNFYNREMMYEAYGASRFYDREDLHLPREDDYVENINWIDDELLFIAAINNTDLNNKFCDIIITGSGHVPYMDDRKELISNVKEIEKIYPDINSEISYYMAAQMKLDKGLEKLIEILKNNNKLNDTVIVIFGDHYPYGINQGTQDKILFKGLKPYEKYKTPFIIYNPEIKGLKVNTLCSTFDILPTISNMFDLDVSNAFMVGKDIFSNGTNKVIFADGSILTDNYYYSTDGSGITKFNIKYDCEEEIDKINKLVNLSQLFLVSDYYRTVK